MFQPEELVLLAGLANEDGLVENRRLKTDKGWMLLFATLIADGYLLAISENVREKGAGDYLISSYRLTAKGRTAALALTSRRLQEED